MTFVGYLSDFTRVDTDGGCPVVLLDDDGGVTPLYGDKIMNFQNSGDGRTIFHRGPSMANIEIDAVFPMVRSGGTEATRTRSNIIFRYVDPDNFAHLCIAGGAGNGVYVYQRVAGSSTKVMGSLGIPGDQRSIINFHAITVNATQTYFRLDRKQNPADAWTNYIDGIYPYTGPASGDYGFTGAYNAFAAAVSPSCDTYDYIKFREII